jgi:hypothetical protein
VVAARAHPPGPGLTATTRQVPPATAGEPCLGFLVVPRRAALDMGNRGWYCAGPVQQGVVLRWAGAAKPGASPIQQDSMLRLVRAAASGLRQERVANPCAASLRRSRGPCCVLGVRRVGTHRVRPHRCLLVAHLRRRPVCLLHCRHFRFQL